MHTGVSLFASSQKVQLSGSQNENHSERTRQNVFAILRSIQYPLGRQDIVY